MTGAHKNEIGRYGEQLAAQFLAGKGYQIVSRNWRCPHGEIDLIVQYDDTLVFVEVRTRRAENTETAFESIVTHKQQRLQSLAEAYLAAHNLNDTPWRIDLVAVALPRSGRPIIEHVENGLDW